MTDFVRNHFRAVGTYTCAGPYRDYFRSLPDDLRTLGSLLCGQILHRVTLRDGNTFANADLRYGDLTFFPWYRMRCEDDIFLTAPAMTAELFRLDPRGFVPDRRVEDKLVLTCRYLSVLFSAVCKAKGIPCRSRAGFAPYFVPGKSLDHWINQVWCEELQRWITLDADGFYDEKAMGLNQYDLQEGQFDWAARAWLNIRSGKTDGSQYLYADGLGPCSLKAVIRYLFYDFHALMNQEISYRFQPCYLDEKFDSLTEAQFRELDRLAELLLEPDENLQKLISLWESTPKFRILNSPLVGDRDNLPLLAAAERRNGTVRDR